MKLEILTKNESEYIQKDIISKIRDLINLKNLDKGFLIRAKVVHFYDMKHRQEISQTKILSSFINSPFDFQNGKKKLE